MGGDWFKASWMHIKEASDPSGLVTLSIPAVSAGVGVSPGSFLEKKRTE